VGGALVGTVIVGSLESGPVVGVATAGVVVVGVLVVGSAATFDPLVPPLEGARMTPGALELPQPARPSANNATAAAVVPALKFIDRAG
jgi:hypothetical protein